METDEKFEFEWHLLFALSLASYFGQYRSVWQVAPFTFLRWYMYALVVAFAKALECGKEETCDYNLIVYNLNADGCLTKFHFNNCRHELVQFIA